MAKVSFVVAVYNVSEYIEHCARTLFEQTLEDIEIVFVDDCSPDNSVALIRHLLESYPHREKQVKFVRHEENKGLPASRKDGVEASAGEYILFVDGDDYVETNMAERLYAFAKETASDIVIFDSTNVLNGTTKRFDRFEDQDVVSSELIRDRTMNHLTSPTVWCRMYRRELFGNQFPWPPCNMAEDVALTSVITYFAEKLSYLHESFYYYRFNPESITKKNSAESEWRCSNEYRQNMEVVKAFFEEHGLAEKYARGLLSGMMSSKNRVLPFTDKPRYRRLWFSTFPEATKIMFWGNGQFKSTYREKIWIIVIALGLFPLLGRRLMSKRLRPDTIWRGDFTLSRINQ